MTENGLYWKYLFSFYWEQDGDHATAGESASKDMPTGRIRNSISLDYMFREEMNNRELIKWARDWWERYAAYRDKLVDPLAKPYQNRSDLVIIITGPRRTTWCLQWFNHWTWDEGQSDEEVLESFEEYVRATPTRELMGAEDRWRWCGGATPEEKTPAPCRCEACKKTGVIRINH